MMSRFVALEALARVHEVVEMLRVFIAALVGGAVGYGYYRVVGCRTGACPITANPYTAIAYGVLMGLLFSR